MQQKNSTEQSRSRTRNQRKRELRRTICLAFAMGIMWLMVFSMMVGAWMEHPAEQPISYSEHMEYVQIIGGDSYGNLQD